MKTVISSFESMVESLLKLASAALKFSIALGSACVIIYALRVGHFPQGLTLGDGLLFLLAVSCFGVIYAVFVGCLLSIGICLSLVTRPMFNLIFKIIKKKTKSAKQPAYELAHFHWGAIPLAGLGLLLIWGLGQKNIAAYWNLPCLSVFLYLLYSAVKSAGAKYRSHEWLLNTRIETPEKNELMRSGEAGKAKNTYLSCISMMMLTPILVGGVSGQLMDGAMRIAQIRIEGPTIYVKAPYNVLLPKVLITNEFKTPEDYIAYVGTTVQFRGFGNSTVITFQDGQRRRQLDIPNDHIIVEKKPE